jgi:hypothetical protein
MAPAASPGAPRFAQGEIRCDVVTEGIGRSSNDDGDK